jgi:HSP20 family protein
MKSNDKDAPHPAVRGQVDAFFRQALGPLSPRRVGVSGWNPQLDVTEEEEKLILEMDLPGVRREDVNVELRGHTLVISGSRKIVRRIVGARYTHSERVSGTFRRTVPLPRQVEEEGITASMEEGILRLELPKKGTGS